MTCAPTYAEELDALVLSAEGVTWARGQRYSVQGFMRVDPLASVMPSLTPYRYGFNNPMSFTDPSGLYASSHILYNEMRNSQSARTKNERSESHKDEMANDPATLDVDIVNCNNSKATTESITIVAFNAQNILERNGLPITRLSLHFLTEKDLFRIRKFYTHRDRHLFIGITINCFSTVANSDIKHNLTVDTYSAGGPLSGVDYDKVTSHYGTDPQHFGWIMAHELGHQLDAFSRAAIGDDQFPRIQGGHYDGVSLLMKRQGYSSDLIQGGEHELFPPSVKSRILNYINR